MLMAIACESLEPLGEVECEDEEENSQSMPVTLCVWTLLPLMKYHSARAPSRGLHPSLLQLNFGCVAAECVIRRHTEQPSEEPSAL